MKTYLFDQMTDEDMLTNVRTWAQQGAGLETEDWYQGAHTFAVGMAERYGISVRQAAGIIAALSPRLSWELNLAYADKLCRERKAPTLKRNQAKALAILDGADPDEVLGGDKVRAFFACIVDPQGSQAVCIDRHAFDIAVGQATSDAERKVLERKGVYARIAGVYARVAAEMGIPAHRVQSQSWVAWRIAKAA